MAKQTENNDNARQDLSTFVNGLSEEEREEVSTLAEVFSAIFLGMGSIAASGKNLKDGFKDLTKEYKEHKEKEKEEQEKITASEFMFAKLLDSTVLHENNVEDVPVIADLKETNDE